MIYLGQRGSASCTETNVRNSVHGDGGMVAVGRWDMEYGFAHVSCQLDNARLIHLEEHIMRARMRSSLQLSSKRSQLFSSPYEETRKLRSVFASVSNRLVLQFFRWPSGAQHRAHTFHVRVDLPIPSKSIFSLTTNSLSLNSPSLPPPDRQLLFHPHLSPPPSRKSRP